MVEIKNLRKTAERIIEAIKNKEKIILYGDADLDGVTSVIILKETIKDLGSDVETVYFPDREAEGYGLSLKSLDYLKKFSPALLITLDCGIGNFKEVDLAENLGFKVIILDHHEVLEKLPKASLIVDPKQKGDESSFKKLANAGLTFELSQMLLGEKMTDNLKRNFLELVAIATLADQMPKESENKIFIEEGLSNLSDSWRPGIKAFFESEFLDRLPFISQKVSRIISLLNIRDVKNQLPLSFRLLTVSSLKEAKEMIKDLVFKSRIRREKIRQMLNEVEKRIAEKPNNPLVFEGDQSFELVLLSSVASLICQKYRKPTFLYKILKEETQGTVRTPKDVDSINLMKKCQKYPLTYGGHAQASGFRIKNEKLEEFKNCLIKNYNEEDCNQN